MPEMKISASKKTGRETHLTAWADEEDPRPGIFSMGIYPIGRQFYIWRGNEIYWRSNVYPNTFSFASGYESSQGFSTFLTFVVEGAEVSIVFTMSASSIRLRITLVPSGQMRLLLWEKNKWVNLQQFPAVKCDFYAHCGPFTSCANNGSPPLCECFTGFEPKFQKHWDAGIWTDGCMRTRALSCNQRDGFLKYEMMKLPDHAVLIGNTIVSECESLCLGNCSCTAYAYFNLTEGRFTCLNWFGELVDVIDNYITGHDLYIRVHASQPGSVEESRSRKFMRRKKHIIAVALSISLVGLLNIGIFIYLLRRKRVNQKEEVVASFPWFQSTSTASGVGQNDSELVSVSLRSVLVATSFFSEENKLGEGGFGPVYKGYFPENTVVAIKRLSAKSSQGHEEFMNELKLIAKLQHTNLVRLLGCCVEGDEKILIYEFMPNRSLDKFLFDPSEGETLDWTKRFQIIEGIAQGLLYLHKYSRLRVIHRDLKASNILLDEAMTPKISDFGMARIFGMNQIEEKTNRVVGTFGYMSPEYALFGRFSEKSDVYSFGVLLLEIVSGKKNTDFHRTELSMTLLEWAWENVIHGRGSESVDPLIRSTCNMDQAVKCINIGLLCVQEIPSERPRMVDVVAMLSNETATVPLPKAPAFTSRRSSTNAGSSQILLSSSYSTNEVTMTTIEPR